jgi:hypothetical protein
MSLPKTVAPRGDTVARAVVALGEWPGPYPACRPTPSVNRDTSRSADCGVLTEARCRGERSVSDQPGEVHVESPRIHPGSDRAPIITISTAHTICIYMPYLVEPFELNQPHGNAELFVEASPSP